MMSRRLYAVALALALTVVPLSGQISRYSSSGPLLPILELRTGMNRSPIGVGAVVNTTREVGMNVGMSLVFPVAGDFSFSIGANFSEKGLERTIGGVPTLLDLTYIEVPLLFRFGVLSAGPLSLTAIFGPSAGIKLDCSSSILGPTPATDCSDAIHDYDIGGVLGGGLDFGVNNRLTLGVDVTYNVGMRTIGAGALDGIMNSTLTVQSFVGFSVL